MIGHILIDGPLDTRRLTKTTGARPGEPRIYVLAFSTGLIKVGRTADAPMRLRHHVTSARWHGTTVEQTWISQHHDDHTENEKALIRFCRGRATGQTGMEYFTGLLFCDVVAYAESLTFERRDRVVPRWRRQVDQPDGDLPELITFKEVAEVLGLPLRSMKEAAKARQFEHVRIGNAWLMTPEQVAALVAMQTRKSKPTVDPRASTRARRQRKQAAAQRRSAA